MRRGWLEKLAYLGVGIALIAGLVYAWIPRPIAVEIRPIRPGRLDVIIEDDGQTRIKERYVISAPLAGRLSRVQLHAGDAVRARETVLTTLSPIAPALLDKRARLEAESRLKVAEASKQRSQPMLVKALEKLAVTKEEFERLQRLYEARTITHEERDRAKFEYRTAEEELRAAELDVEIAKFEIEVARAALVHTQAHSDGETTEANDWLIEIRSPVSGRVLRVLQESSAVVAAGAPLLEVGDPQDLEIVVDILSSDAVKLRPGNPVVINEWGGTESLQAHVRLVEPSGFTKISALGIEEKRVNVIIDFDTPFEKRATLGDDFRIEARIIVDRAERVLLLPNGALFREADQDLVYLAVGGRAELRPITIGRRGQSETEVISGLTEGDHVIVYPSDKVKPGVQLQIR